MKFLLIPGNNSLSHVAKCLAAQEALASRGHQVLIAASRKHVPFLSLFDCQHTVLPDIQEADDGSAPSMAWFRHPDRIRACIEAEIALLKTYRPDRVLGVFRFTAKAAAALCHIPYDALACGCMMPDNPEVLGFAGNEKGRRHQAQYLDNFYRFAARKISLALKPLGCPPIDDIRWMLMGDRTFLWDFPQFMPLPAASNRYHIGPLRWSRWPGKETCRPSDLNGGRPQALLSFGTRDIGRPRRKVAEKLVNSLLKRGYAVMIAAGGQPDLMNILPRHPGIRIWPFVPLDRLLEHVALVICHGGQMTIFESLQRGVPVGVVPFQPEQAHNGVCLERIGCGARLVPAVAFKGCADVYCQALQRLSADRLQAAIRTLTEDPCMDQRLALAANALRSLSGAPLLARLMERN